MNIIKLFNQKYISNTSWLIVERGLQMLITLFVGIKLAVYMTPAEWGFYNWAASLVIIFAELARVGLPNITVKFLVKNDYDHDVIMGSSLLMKIVGSLISITLIMLLAFKLESSAMGRYLVLLTALPYLLKTLDLIMYHFEAEVKSKFIVLSRFSGILINNLIKLYIIFTNKPVEWVYYVFTIDAIIFVSLLIYFYKKEGHKIVKWKVSFEVVKKLFSNSWPLILSVMIYNLYMRIDQLMIKEILGETMNGHYAAATKLSSAWYAIPWLITGSIFPSILKSFEKDVEAFKNKIKVLYEFLILLAIFIIIPITLFGDELVNFIYSNKYYLSGEVLKIHIWASVFVFIGYAGTKWLIIKDLERLSFLYILGGCIINIITNYIFIPIYGINGAAWATLVAQFTSYILMPLFNIRTRDMFKVQLIAMLETITIILPIKNIYRFIKNLNLK